MKAGKVIRNSLLVIVGLVIVILVALQILLRPQVLTGLVNDFAADYVEGQVNFREVRAHVIKSFPYLNIDAHDFSITYPHERYARYDTLYPSETRRRFNLLRAGQGKEGVDTLMAFRRLSVSVNYMSLLGKNVIHVHKLEVERPRIFAHYYVVLKKSLPLSSTRMKAGKSSTVIFQMASIPSSGYSTHSMLRMLLWDRTAATPPMVPR